MQISSVNLLQGLCMHSRLIFSFDSQKEKVTDFLSPIFERMKNLLGKNDGP